MKTPLTTRNIEDQLEEVEQDARRLVAGLSERCGAWRSSADSWSVAECLDHLAIANRTYLGAMRPATSFVKEKVSKPSNPLGPKSTKSGIVGQWVIRTMEPPVRKLRSKAPASIRPRNSAPLGDSFLSFMESHSEVRAFLLENANLDLAGVRFANPFLKGVRFSVTTGLHIMAAHERRHLWQAWQVRESYSTANGS